MYTDIDWNLTEIHYTNDQPTVAEEGRRQLRISHEYEAMSDRLASLLKGKLKLRDNELELPVEQQEQLHELHAMVTEFVVRVTKAYEQRKPIDPAEAQAMNKGITRRVKQIRDEHLTSEEHT